MKHDQKRYIFLKKKSTTREQVGRLELFEELEGPREGIGQRVEWRHLLSRARVSERPRGLEERRVHHGSDQPLLLAEEFFHNKDAIQAEPRPSIFCLQPGDSWWFPTSRSGTSGSIMGKPGMTRPPAADRKTGDTQERAWATRTRCPPPAPAARICPTRSSGSSSARAAPA